MHVRKNNLGFITELIGAAGALTGGGDSGGGTGAGASSSPTVSPQISTQISPQISPIFQQQFQPSGSAMSAGTAQSLPAMPALGTGSDMVPSGYSPVATVPAGVAVPSVPSSPTDWAKYVPWIIGGGLALYALKQWGGKRAGA